MTNEAIATVQEDLARDLYELTAIHREEITHLMEEFDAHDIDMLVRLDGYERQCRQQTVELGASTDQLHAEDDDVTGQDKEANTTNTEQGTEEEPSLFDIRHDDEEDGVDDDDPEPSGHQE